MKIILKYILGFALCLLAVQNIKAQNIRFGLKAGTDFSTWGGKDVKDADLGTNIGYHAGAFAEFPISHFWGLESGVYLSRKGFTADEELFGVKFDLTNTSTYLDVPVLVKYAITRNYSIMAGPQVSILLDNKLTMEASGEKATDRSVSGFKKLDLGAVAGMGYQFNNGLLMNANYDFGLIKLDDVTNTNSYNRVVKVSVGYRFN